MYVPKYKGLTWKLPALEKIWDQSNRRPVLFLSAVTVVLLALIDWWTKPYVSLGFLYLFPVMLAAAFLPRPAVASLGGLCAVLAELFSALEPSLMRLAFEALALAGCGLFVVELVRNRRLTLEAEEGLRAVIGTSPAAIVTVDREGFIELANQAAIDLIAPREGILAGMPIAAFLPELHFALVGDGTPDRVSMKCECRRGNGESFEASIWFSLQRDRANRRLSAIIVDGSEPEGTTAGECRSGCASPEEWSERETNVLQLLLQGLVNKEIAARLGVSESGVKNILQQLFARTGVRTRAQLVRIALERNWRPASEAPAVTDDPRPAASGIRPLSPAARRALSAHRTGAAFGWSSQAA